MSWINGERGRSHIGLLVNVGFEIVLPSSSFTKLYTLFKNSTLHEFELRPKGEVTYL